ncbi:Uncharacterized conserved protein, contains GH25 family domain [Pseudoxanthomonas sp. GM95]|uniref:DUF4198 domain-containing protein n=1 Tax=Pseudoxanthomonas sp. GM95 TaxID=1881043 RepID=UPI0008B22253|nr:SpaA isopeptide-forming pilin-related protein [Pseudoxanthomonas sp. GM95]SEK94684.1 Uncharacterized conserved protein, contains GH25 family domain [Pseudoxanthomonas sp. GM95]
MKRPLLVAALLAGMLGSAQAHEIWIERDGAGPVRVYFGEPAQAELDHGQDEIKRIVKPTLFGAKGKAGALAREGDHLTAPLQGAGDAWLSDASVFEPWKGEDGRFEAVSYYARAGRSQAESRLAFELIPRASQGNAFTLQFRDKPLADAEVTLINADKWTRTLKSGADGLVTLPTLAAGRYIVVASHKEAVDTRIGAQQVAVMHHITTLTFKAD